MYSGIANTVLEFHGLEYQRAYSLLGPIQYLSLMDSGTANIVLECHGHEYQRAFCTQRIGANTD